VLGLLAKYRCRRERAALPATSRRSLSAEATGIAGIECG
jgi:hypothetical protein